MVTLIQSLASRFRHPVAIIAVLGCAISGAVFFQLVELSAQANVDLYRRAAHNRLNAIQRLADTDLALVRGVAQSLELAPAEMDETQSRRWLCPFAGDSHDIRLFGYWPLAPGQDGTDSIALHNCRPATATGDQLVVLERNARWQKFLDQSAASGEPVLTPAFQPQIEGQDGAVSLIVMPVRVDGQLRGHAVAALEYSRVLERAISRFESYGIHVGLTEWTPGEPERTLAFHQSRRAAESMLPKKNVSAAESALGSVTTTVNVGGRRWLGYCLPVPEAIHPEVKAGIGPLLFGLLLTALLCLYLRTAQNRRRQVESLVAERTRELAAARDQAVEALEVKSVFLATVSHEVRTPLNGVVGLTDLLADTPLNAEQRDLVDNLRGSAAGLMVIVNDILDLSRIEAGKFPLAQEPFDLLAVIDQATRLFAGQARQKGLELSCSVPDEVCLRLQGDAIRLGQIMANLVSNSVKFTHQGSVRVTAEPVERTAEQVQIRISVRDTGIGIDPGVAGRLFQPFTQADGSAARRHGGTGLGLAISRGLAQLMGGDVGFESRPGYGSHFWVMIRLPLAEPAAPTAAADPRSATAVATEPVGGGQPAEAVGETVGETPVARTKAGPSRSALPQQAAAQVLLVEDNPINQRVALGLLKKLGYQAQAVDGGEAAVTAVRDGSYDLILMDCQMPEMDGYEATAAIRDLPAPASLTPIIALTANSMPGDRERCLAAGMDDYLSKPVQLTRLAETLERWQGEACGSVPDDPTVPTQPGNPGVDNATVVK
ncbi:MAG: ATP-binding protein [Acidobacteria bacterium]|nr:ATP-binding protein [Acidobacteriota bacterium]